MPVFAILIQILSFKTRCVWLVGVSKELTVAYQNHVSTPHNGKWLCKTSVADVFLFPPMAAGMMCLIAADVD